MTHDTVEAEPFISELIIAAREEGRKSGLEEAGQYALAQANELERMSYQTGKLPENFADVNKWRSIAAAIRKVK
jgi:hypothetical protein